MDSTNKYYLIIKAKYVLTNLLGMYMYLVQIERKTAIRGRPHMTSFVDSSYVKSRLVYKTTVRITITLL